MSGLAQMLAAYGHKVSGSDRALKNPENARIFSALEKQGIKLYPQDGSFINDGLPGAIIYSTAIENDNPDFKCLPPETRRIHRAEALEAAIKESPAESMIAVTGSCGKTSVSAWIAETLTNLGLEPSLITGGLANRFREAPFAGNFYPGKGKYMLVEADESDKSLTAYTPDYGVILNIGTDHYSKEELADVFRQFIGKVKKGIVIEDNVYRMLGHDALNGLDFRIFSAGKETGELPGKVFRVTSYTNDRKGNVKTSVNGHEFQLPMPGCHNAANAAAVIALADLVGISTEKIYDAVSNFHGVWRRFDFAGRTKGGTRIYDDYAHNVEKIISCMKAASEISTGKLLTIFQPHGYGPLGFMKDELHKALCENLRDGDTFALLPVYYAGGTSSFKPSSEEVIKEYNAIGSKASFMCMPDRAAAAKFIKENLKADDIVLICGARDNSLSDWAVNLCKEI